LAIYPSLRGRAVLITGGAGGIGAAMVQSFAAQGAEVAFLDRDQELSSRTADAVREATGHAPTFVGCDLVDVVASREAVRQLANTVGPFSVLVNNAGNDAVTSFRDLTPEQFDDRIAVNLRHQLFMAQAVAPGMTASGGGSIINLGSISWMIGAANVVAYSIAKAGVEGMTRALARELGTAGIRVNSIAPGWVLTERQLEKGRTDLSKFGTYLERQCLKEHLKPQDVAELALWLAADESRRCTAHTWYIDAGAS
jgi:NAD(P)-dependent dehydrogenase (short-subunit alcohol dehydrogenase family)